MSLLFLVKEASEVEEEDVGKVEGRESGGAFSRIRRDLMFLLRGGEIEVSFLNETKSKLEGKRKERELTQVQPHTTPPVS